jgi:RNA ligase (TIGR02306 family)
MTEENEPDIRQLVTIRRVSALNPIEGADAIELAQIDGWGVVVKKGELHVNDEVLYFELDCLLPVADPRFAFLKRSHIVDGIEYHRLKTIRLRGQYSQGLAIPLAQFPEFDVNNGYLHGIDSPAELLGVIKYEPDVPAQMRGKIAGNFPTHLARKTDSERVQNLGMHFLAPSLSDYYWGEGKPRNFFNYNWTATEKIDGTSCTVSKDAEGVLHVCSRNWELSPSDKSSFTEHAENIYFKMVREYELEDWLAPGTTLQFEIFGEGIQKNPLGIKGNSIALFNVETDRIVVPREQWVNTKLPLAPVYDVPFPKSVEEAVAQVDGLKSLINPERQAEGIVWTTDQVVPFLDRNTFKSINNRYLLKDKN